MDFNQYNMYSYNAGLNSTQVLDEVDTCKLDLMRMTEYGDVKNYLTNKFGEVQGEKWIEFPELKKHIYINIDDEKCEFCTLKDREQYFGRGWYLVDNND